MRVLERSRSLPRAPRTLIATSALRHELGSVAESSIVNEIRGFELFANGKVAGVALSKPDLVVDRSLLIRDLAARAQRCGAEISFSSRFTGMETRARRFGVFAEISDTSRTETFRSRELIGADGAFSRVARAAGWPEQTTVPLIQALVRCPSGLPADTVRVWFRPQDTPYFYWLIPDADGHGVLGLIGHSRRHVRSKLDAFLKDRRLKALSYQAARIPLYTRWRPLRKRLQGRAVYLVGDAAGHVKPTTVGGLVTGFRGASAVVDAVLRRRSSTTRALRRELDRHLLVRRALHRFGEHEYTRLLELLGDPEHRLLASYSRDDTYRLLWRLCVREPRIAVLAAARLVRGSSVGWVGD